MNVSYHLAQYTSIIAELRSEIDRLRAKIDQQSQEQHKGEKADICDNQGVFNFVFVFENSLCLYLRTVADNIEINNFFYSKLTKLNTLYYL